MSDEMPQPAMIAHLKQICIADPHLQAAMLYGSFPLGEADAYSDIDCVLYFNETSLPEIDRRAWVSQIAPVLVFYHNQFNNWATVFDNLVRAEFHFNPLSKLSELSSLQGTIWFPSIEATLLVDKTGELTRHLVALTGTRPAHKNLQTLEYVTNDFCNWILFGLNVFARGEHARALEILHIVHDALLQLVRMHESQTGHWISPIRMLEVEISNQAYRRYQACTAALEPSALARAYQHTWEWGRSLLESLHKRYDRETPDKLLHALDRALLERLAS